MTANTEALALAAELEGFAEGSNSARASLMRDAARTIRALVPEPAIGDEREALIALLDDDANWHYTGARTVFLPERGADAILASEVWRNRHRGPITQADVDLAYEAFVAGPTDAKESMRAALKAAEDARTNHTDGDNT